MSNKLRKQCKKCPWKVGTNPREIPNGYCETKHKALADTIATTSDPIFKNRKKMACHETTTDAPLVCVGWLHNQLGPGNNIALRLAAMHKQVDTNYEIVGPQHERFEDTLP